MPYKEALLGVLGGMGPDATAYFYTRFNHHWRLVSTTSRQDDYPRILIDSLPVPDVVLGALNPDVDRRIAALMLDSLQLFEKLGVRYVAIPCNTAHRQLGVLQRETACRILNMVEMVVERVARDGHTRVGLLSTLATIESGLYSESCNQLGLDLLVPRSATVQAVAELILEIIGGGNTSTASELLAEAVAELRGGSAATAIIIGCTDLSLVLGELRDRPHIYDSTEVCAEAAARLLWASLGSNGRVA